ncbi:MAG: protease inhibitor I42 family protein [Terracidiphilus sp.]|jgi:inhibitor of cysteine peptidase
MMPDRLIRRIDSMRWLLVLVAIACFSQAALGATKVVTDADKGGVVHMKLVDQLELRLKANPSTGYMWYIEKESTPLLKLHHQTQTEVPVPAEEKPGLVGQPVFQVFTFEPRHVGEGVLRMHYVRSWEKPTPDDVQFEIRVVIE